MAQYVTVQTRIHETLVWTGDNFAEVTEWLRLDAQYFTDSYNRFYVVTFDYPGPQVHVYEQGDEIVQQVADRRSTERIRGLSRRPNPIEGDFVEITEVFPE